MKRDIPLIIVFITGIIMAFSDFIPHQSIQTVREFFMSWLQIIGVLAVGLGLVSLVHVNVVKVKRKAHGWGYSLITLIGLFLMLITGSIWNYRDSRNPFQFLFQYALLPIYATMFSLLAFYIASAAFRAFKMRSFLATLVLVTAVIVMLGQVPIGARLSGVKSWIMEVPNMAGFRAILLGIGLGGVATALKIIFGIERSYMGRD
ncbi:MAG: hypothetical protein A2161_02495 [Candidatus Schekmanbacteria bacterium RBG_13_48_7]|uniref:Uncharacterized protein n=1 Tax=Candidatus Schekmanbacteria bacterium RBG_13_48_7 TaxID=1817878 RepID=A0A1F7RNM2_9BACT|nr:MAG: hypothetical protein A2161_02495 [Candidatus Schekmanbacteria bacterium RBG_13_48_7]